MLRISVVQQADFNNIGILVAGDGTSTVLSFKVNQTPFNINYQGRLPDSLVVSDFDETFSATATMATVGSDIEVTVTFNEALPLVTDFGVDTQFSVNLMSLWNSL